MTSALGGATRCTIGGDARAATEYGTDAPLIKLRRGVARRQSPSHSRARARFHAGVVRNVVRVVGRGAGGAGRDGHGRRPPDRAALALAGRHGRARFRLRAKAGASTRTGSLAVRPQHAGQHLGPARLLSQPAGAAGDIRCAEDFYLT